MAETSPSVQSVASMLKEGRWLDAFEGARTLARSRPELAEAWHLLSLACQQLGQVEGAAKAAETAARLSPGNGAFRLQHAMSLALAGRVRSAIVLARGLEPAAAGNAAISSKLGTVFNLSGAHQQAYALFRRAAELEPASADHAFNCAVAGRALGRLDEAEAACDAAIDLGLEDRRVFYVRSDLRRQTTERNHVVELEAQLARADLSPMDRVYLGYALGKEQDDLEEWEAAFRSYAGAARSYRDLIRYEPAADYAVLEALPVLHSRNALDALPAGDEGPEPIFVVGLPRSGTTLVERIVQGAAGVESVGERQNMAREIGARARAQRSGGAAERSALVEHSLAIDTRALARAYWSEVGFDDGTRRPLDKMPINYLYLGLISRAFPRAKIIMVRRAPMDSCFSAWKAFLTGPYGFSYDLGELADYFLRFDRLCRHWSAVLPPWQYREVSYESLVLDTEATVRDLLAFLNIPFDPAVLAFHRAGGATATASAAQVRRPIYRESVDRVRHFAPWLEPLRQRLAAGGLVEDSPSTG